MSATLVLQSCPASETTGWLADCMQSVRGWAEQQGCSYRWLDDELFSILPDALRPGERITPVIASDLARLEWARDLLRNAQAEQVIWFDADVLVFDPDHLSLPQGDSAVGREIWVQVEADGRLRSYKKVHNAALYFRADAMGRNSFLDFYADTARRLLTEHTGGGMPPQFIGPKLLTALHNVVQLPVWESVGMVSPALAEDLLGANNGALACYARKAAFPVAAANLCRSSVAQGALSVGQMQQLARLLMAGALSCPAGMVSKY